MGKKRIFIGFSFIICLVGVFSFAGDDRHFEMSKNLDLFASVYIEVHKYYVDEVNPSTILRTGIDAMLKQLDPYTVYIPEDDVENFRTATTGEYGGIGIQSDKRKGRHVIINLYKDFPAYTAGLKIGDEITAVDGLSTKKLTDSQLGKLMKGQAGSSISVEVSRQNTTLVIAITRKKIHIPNISYSAMLTKDVGYLKLSEFTNDAAKDVRETVEQLKSQGATRLVIDLRGNPGGLLYEAIDICNLFVPKGSKIVDTKGKRKANNQSYMAKRESMDLSIPLAILIDGGSASASEIVSGVIQDYDRGVIVGQKSYGKGLVQVSRPLSYNSHLKVTISKYYIPSGRCIQALDYSNRNQDGSVGEIADSLKTEFRTTNNRKVYDGGGIDPDIVIDNFKLSSYATNLKKSMLIFDFATQYYYKHDTIAPPSDFRLTDQEYDIFVKWLRTQSFDNTSSVETTLSILKIAASKDKVYNTLVDEIEAIKAVVDKLKADGVYAYKGEIVKMLENEIILRYYYTPGKIARLLDKDPVIKSALKILADSEAYLHTLER